MSEETNRTVAEWLGVHWHAYRQVGGTVVDPDTGAMNISSTFFHCDGCGYDVWPHCQLPNPAYDTNPAAMLELIEAVRDQGHTIEITVLEPDMCIDPSQSYRVVVDGRRSKESISDTLPAAVSAAVLKLIEQEATDGKGQS